MTRTQLLLGVEAAQPPSRSSRRHRAWLRRFRNRTGDPRHSSPGRHGLSRQSTASSTSHHSSPSRSKGWSERVDREPALRACADRPGEDRRMSRYPSSKVKQSEPPGEVLRHQAAMHLVEGTPGQPDRRHTLDRRLRGSPASPRAAGWAERPGKRRTDMVQGEDRADAADQGRSQKCPPVKYSASSPPRRIVCFIAAKSSPFFERPDDAGSLLRNREAGRPAGQSWRHGTKAEGACSGWSSPKLPESNLTMPTLS